MSKTDFRDKKLPGEQGTIVTAEIMARLNNQVPTGEDFDGSAPLLYGIDIGTANAYSVDLVFGKIVSERVNTQLQTNRLFDINATFQADGVEAGDTALNVSDRTSATVVSVDDENTLTLDSHIFPTDGKKYAVGPHIFQAPEALAEGMEIAFIAADANTAVSTLSVNGLAPVSIRKQGDAELSTWDIRAGQVVKAVYDGTNFQILNPTELLSEQERIVSTWIERSNPKNITLNGITCNGSLFCAVGRTDGTDAYIITSPDGVTWTERSNPKNVELNGITWNGSQFVAVGYLDGVDAYIVTSPNGVTWTERSNPKNAGLIGITWSGSLFCAVGYQDGTDAYIVTSADGITWTERNNPKNLNLMDIAWNGSVFCAVGFLDGVDAYIVTSPDGITWTERSNPKNKWLNGVAWNGSLFCAVGSLNPPGDAYIITSPDGITWTERANPKNCDLVDVTWNGSLFVAVGVHDGTDAYIITSADGITWTERANPKNIDLFGVTWNGSLFCAAGWADGTDAYIVTSLRL